MPVGSIHIIPTSPEEESGYSSSVFNLCQGMIDEKNPTTLATFRPVDSQFVKYFVESFSFNLCLRKIGISSEFKYWLRQQVVSQNYEIVHAHSLWRFVNLYPALANKNSATKFVVSPRGALSEAALNYSFIVKNIFHSLFQASALQSAAAFHATSEKEFLEIRAAGFDQPVAVIPNGINVPNNTAVSDNNCKQILFIGRIHPIKGINNLLMAWSTLHNIHKDWQLVIAGSDSETPGYLSELKQLARSLNLERCKFIGSVYGEEKANLYLRSDIVVLPSHSENFGMVVAESLAAATPVIVSKGAPWETIIHKDAGWSIDIGAEPLEIALNHALSLPINELKRMGCNGRDWMIEDFSWKNVAINMGCFYDWLVNGGDMPSFVRLD
ncbi:glycosyltransferase [Pseudomonadota bacterium]|nr:glycosyltransferase [Pseudomonadota bacterium]